MKTKITISSLAVIAILFASCKKNDTGGDATVAAITKHHDKKIPFSTVYVKYDAKEFPGEDLSQYDASQMTDKEGHTHFEGLRYGNYFFYGVGYDSSSQAIVKGGVAVQIKWKERKDELEVVVQITE